MSRTKQPYLPLYVQDWLSNTNLKDCSLEAHGLMINLMCIMHKEDDYGQILLKQKYKQTDKQINNFASQLAKPLPFSSTEIEAALTELVNERILKIENDSLICERMVRDANLSKIRSLAGKTGGINAQNKEDFASTFAKAKFKANAENENENENDIILVDTVFKKEKNKKRKKRFVELTKGEDVPVKILAELYGEDFKLIDSVSNTTGRTAEELKSYLPNFVEHLTSLGRSTETPAEFAKYFLNTMKLDQLPSWTTAKFKPAANSTDIFVWTWTGQNAPKRGNEAQYLSDKKNFGMFGFKTIQTPNRNA
jgi:hypothetical protein